MSILVVGSIVLVVVAFVAFVIVVVAASTARAARQAARAAYFSSRYGSSVDRMLQECLQEQGKLRAIRDSGRSGPAQAVRQLLRTEPVPLAVAAEFIKRL